MISSEFIYSPIPAIELLLPFRMESNRHLERIEKMKQLMMMSVFVVALTGCFQETIDDVENTCETLVEGAIDQCEEMVDEALQDFSQDLWEDIDKKVQGVFADIGCTKVGVGQYDYDCSDTILCDGA